MWKKRMGKGIMAYMALILLLNSFSLGAFAAESIRMDIPIVARGADCEAVIADANGNTLQTLALKKGVESSFTVECDGLKRFVYTVRLTDADTDDVIYDKTVYETAVTLYYRPSGELSGALEIRLAGDVAAPKKETAEFVNKVITPVSIDPPVKKRVEGSPKSDGTFTFVMTAVSNTAGLERMPMPNGAAEQRVTMQIIGSGEKEFGDIELKEEGVYTYAITEQKGDAAGYTYDTSVYNVIATVTRGENGLAVTTVRTKDGVETDDIVFTNVYTEPASSDTAGTTSTSSSGGDSGTGTGTSPRTGDERNLGFWIGSSAAVLLAILALAVYYIRQRRRDKRSK